MERILMVNALKELDRCLEMAVSYQKQAQKHAGESPNVVRRPRLYNLCIRNANSYLRDAQRVHARLEKIKRFYEKFEN